MMTKKTSDGQGTLIATLKNHYEATNPSLLALESEVTSHFSTKPLANYDTAIVQIYYHFYTVPVLEASQLISLTASDRNRALLFAKVNAYLSLYLRYMDFILDDKDSSFLPSYQRKCQQYLLAAHRLLRDEGYEWHAEHDGMLLQQLDYEQEIFEDGQSDWGTLWRRVSPLCLILMFAGDRLKTGRFPFVFKRYLEWSLLVADCNDAYVDMSKGVKTPIVTLLQEVRTNTFQDFSAWGKKMNGIRLDLARMKNRLLVETQLTYPILHKIIQETDAFVFS